LLVLVVAALALGCVHVTEGATPGGDLFVPADGATGRATPSAAWRDGREVEVRSELLARAAPVAMTLADGRRYLAVRSSLERRSSSDFTWRGRLLPSDEADTVTITVVGGKVSALVYAPTGVYALVPGAGKAHTLARDDARAFEECEVIAAPPDDVALPSPSPSTGEPAASAKAKATHDVLVLYTSAARDAAGGDAAIRATIQSAVDVANTAYANSRLKTRLRLVAALEAGYVEGAETATPLNWLTNDAGVAATRDRYAADVVSLFVEAADYCGLSWMMGHARLGPGFQSRAFSVVKRVCAVENLSFAHEIGHNQGNLHDPANSVPFSDVNGPAYPYSYGHVTPTFRTIMAYGTECGECPRVAHFSNPNVSYAGEPTGIAFARDAARTIANTAAIVDGFREQGASGTVPLLPFDVRAARVRKTKVGIAWADASTNETSFEVVAFDGGGWRVVAETPAGATTARVAGLERRTAYTFGVRACNAVGCSEVVPLEVTTK
jgi:hypothetical protein